MTQGMIQAANTAAAPGGVNAEAAAARVRGVAGITIILLAVRGGFPLLMWLIWRIAPHTMNFSTVRTINSISDVLQGLLAVVGFIFFLIWTHRLISALNARGEATRMTPGFAVGSYFIPFANLVLPILGLTDAWRRATNTGAGLVVGWWLAYWGYIIIDTTKNTMIQLHVGFDALPVLFWLSLLAALTAYGLWVFMVRRATDAISPPRAA